MSNNGSFFCIGVDYMLCPSCRLDHCTRCIHCNRRLDTPLRQAARNNALANDIRDVSASQAKPCAQPSLNQFRNCTAPVTGNFAEEVYGVRFASELSERCIPVTCCDNLCGCREFNLLHRSPFWPAFAHPRWLSCQQLYTYRPQCRCRCSCQ